MTEQRYPGIWKISFGTPSNITPHSLLQTQIRSEQLWEKEEAEPPFDFNQIKFRPKNYPPMAGYQVSGIKWIGAEQEI